MTRFWGDIKALQRAIQRSLERTSDIRYEYRLRMQLGYEKAMLSLNIMSLPKDKQEVAYSRIQALEKIDKYANYYNLTSKFVQNNDSYADILTPKKYLQYILDDELFESIPIDKFAKLLMNTTTNTNDVLPTVSELKNTFGVEFLDYIMKQDNPLAIIDEIRTIPKNCSLTDTYNTYMQEHPDEDKSELFKNLTTILSNPYMLTIIEDKIDDINDIINLEDYFRSHITDKSFYSGEGKVRIDVLLIYLYNFSLEQVKNIVNKYGKDLNDFKSADSDAISKIMKLNPNYYQKIIALYPTISMIGLTDKEISAIDENRLNELANIQEKFSIIKEMKAILDSDKNTPEQNAKLVEYVKSRANEQHFISYVDFEKELIQIFENEYNHTAYNPMKKANRLDSLSEKLGAEVYEIDYDHLDEFVALMRMDNVFHPNINKRGEDRYKVDENIVYDGLALSCVDSQNFTLCPRGALDIISGYSSISGLQNIAPWDFISWKSILSSLAPETAKYNAIKPGIEFHFPRKLTEYARVGTTELSLYKNYYNGDRFEMRKPDYYVYEIDKKHNPKFLNSIEANYERFPEIRSNNIDFNQWYNTIEEAKRTGKPILLIDRKKILDIYKQQINNLSEKVFASDDIDEKINIMTEMISIYEKCSNSTNTVDSHGERIYDDFFGGKNRSNFYNKIFEHIKQTIEKDPDKGRVLLHAYKSLCENELSKLFTNTASRGGGVFSRDRNANYRLDNYDLENEMIIQLDRATLYEAKVYGGNYSTFEPSPDLKELMKAVRQPIGKEEHYNVPGAIHGVEHADKVMLFGDAMAQREGLSDKDRRLVNIACMLHDWKRVDNSSNSTHGIEGAKLIVQEFKNGNLDFLGLRKEDIPIVATAVCYHNYNINSNISFFKNYNKLDRSEILEELQQFGIKDLDFSDDQYMDYIERTQKICSIVRDADNLDRFRFSKHMKTERPTYSYFLTDSARSPELRAYANMVNQTFARMVLMKNYPNEILETDENTDYVEILDRKRFSINDRHSRRNGYSDYTFAERNEIPIDIEELWSELYSKKPRIKVLNPVQKERDDMLDSAIEATKGEVKTSSINRIARTFQSFLTRFIGDKDGDTR